MKAMKKPLLFFFALLMTMSVVATNALAADIPLVELNGSIITPQSEETEWVTRYYNGVLQRRLWSITYAKWLTDWINV
ncbi:MAG: hypothetical protein VB064_11095 [Oscillospiraceae bacterium]|nr:hypothetical protein [Oscillospiraceae bacterium]